MQARTCSTMVTTSLTTALFVSLPTAFFVLLARRSKRSEEKIVIFRSKSSSVCVETNAREHMMRLHALDARRSSGLPSFVPIIAVAVFLSGWCGLAADAVVIPSRVGVAASAGSMSLGGLPAWSRGRGRGRGKLGSADGASQRCVCVIMARLGHACFVWASKTFAPQFWNAV